MENVQGNVSTIAVMLYAILAPYIAKYVSQEVFIAIIGLLAVIWSAYHPNTFAIFNNQKESADNNITSIGEYDDLEPIDGDDDDQ